MRMMIERKREMSLTPLASNGGNDTLQGGDGGDTLKGDEGDDILVGGTGQNYLVGGQGDDRYEFASGDSEAGADGYVDNVFDQGGGIDTVALGGSVTSVTQNADGNDRMPLPQPAKVSRGGTAVNGDWKLAA